MTDSEKIEEICKIKDKVQNMEWDKFKKCLSDWNQWVKDIEANDDLTEKGLHFCRVKSCAAQLMTHEEYWAPMEAWAKAQEKDNK